MLAMLVIPPYANPAAGPAQRRACAKCTAPGVCEVRVPSPSAAHCGLGHKGSGGSTHGTCISGRGTQCAAPRRSARAVALLQPYVPRLPARARPFDHRSARVPVPALALWAGLRTGWSGCAGLVRDRGCGPD